MVPLLLVRRDACTSMGSWIYTLSLAIEKALSVKSNSTSKRQHVHLCSIVRGKWIYGYYFSDELFVKIYLYPHSYFF
ncbi:DNA-directed DNA polymerase protein [Dioscorea alata]|uniref:DNA-directed DNA polymerase protein n=1 Tax=Dioscorea alata TaxID=55571 RepID=A0ACB7WKX4_DIOAL|nr:DNA-directed DNA polymerase protein [Dioscorea alata]